MCARQQLSAEMVVAAEAASGGESQQEQQQHGRERRQRVFARDGTPEMGFMKMYLGTSEELVVRVG
jgi:hypothetical protein